MKLTKLGICGILSFISYAAMVVFSPLAYPGYDWLSMAVSDLSAVGAPSRNLANQLNALYGPCGLVSIMAVCVAIQNCRSQLLKLGIYFFAAMEWISDVGYKLFPWVSDVPDTHPQNIMHLVVTAAVVIFSLAALVLTIIGAAKENMKSLSVLAGVCLLAMLMGPIGMALFPKSVFGLFERFSTMSAVTFNAGLGIFLFAGRLGKDS